MQNKYKLTGKQIGRNQRLCALGLMAMVTPPPARLMGQSPSESLKMGQGLSEHDLTRISLAKAKRERRQAKRKKTCE